MARIRPGATLPASLPPFGINREQAAELVGVSPTTFDKMVAAGRMPRPRIASAGRLVYDVAEVAEAFRKLPHHGPVVDPVDEDGSGSNPWDHD